MGKSSIHIQKASGGAITHNSRENYSKSVVFTDEKNELWNDKKEAYEIYRTEINKRIEAYTNRTNQKLQKTAVTQLSAVVNLEQHHTLKDLEKIKEELEKVFDTKVYQMAIHRDEGKLKHKETGEYLVSGTDFFYNQNDDKYYTKKRVENKKHIFENELNINDYIIEKNYHAHIEMLGLDSKGQAIRQKMNRFVLSNLQDFTAQSLEMERGNLFSQNKSNKRLDTHPFKLEKKRENEVKKIVKNEKNKIVKKANEAIAKSKEIIKEEKAKAKELENLLKEKDKEIRELMKGIGGFKRADFAEIEALKKDLTNAKASEEVIKNSYRVLQSKYELKKKEVIELTNELHFVKCNEVNLLEELEEIKLEVYHPKYKTESGNQVSNKTVANFFENELNKKDLEILDLKKENKSLHEQKKVLEYKVTTLQEKIVSRANMSDYDYILKENAELKKENKSLKEKVKSILKAANEKIKSLFKFKIYNDVKFGYDRLYEEDWEKECDNDVRLEKKYQREIKSELMEEQEQEKINIKDLDLNINTFDNLNENLKQFAGEEKKEEENNYYNYQNDWGMQR